MREWNQNSGHCRTLSCRRVLQHLRLQHPTPSYHNQDYEHFLYSLQKNQFNLRIHTLSFKPGTGGGVVGGEVVAAELRKGGE